MAEHEGCRVEFLRDVGVGEEVVGEFGLFLLEFVDALLDGVLAEELVDEDGVFLADAVGAVGGLGFGGGVLPLPSLACKSLDFFGIVRHFSYNAGP